jgi:hypothetical protein
LDKAARSETAGHDKQQKARLVSRALSNPYYSNFIKVEGIVQPGVLRANGPVFC